MTRDTRCLVLDIDGEELASCDGLEIATYLMNRTHGAASIRSVDGVTLAKRVYLNAATVSDWLAQFSRWS